MPLLLRTARLVLDPARGVVPGWVLIEGGVIRRVGSGDEAPPEAIPSVDCGGDFVAPGLIDLHLHGACGRDAMEASGEAFAAILGTHARGGTTTAVLTTVAAPLSAMIQVLACAREWIARPGCARLAGIHLEGPWFSPRRRGAHAEENLRLPGESEIETLLAFQAVISRVTLAPELPGAVKAIRRLRDAGIPVSAGHSDATESEALAGFAAGITQATHLFNAMSSGRKPGWEGRRGLAEAAMTTPGILCELIADGVHVPVQLLREALSAKGWGNLALVSDATPGAGLPEGSGFRLGDLDCVVEGGAAWTGEGSARCLAGSTATLFDGIRTMTESAGVPLQEAVAMATLVPARALGMESAIGSLDAGKKADLILFSPDWKIKEVWIDGKGILPAQG